MRWSCCRSSDAATRARFRILSPGEIGYGSFWKAYCLAGSCQAIAEIRRPVLEMTMTPNNALERAVKGSPKSAAGASDDLAPAAPGWVLPRPAQRGR